MTDPGVTPAEVPLTKENESRTPDLPPQTMNNQGPKSPVPQEKGSSSNVNAQSQKPTPFQVNFY